MSGLDTDSIVKNMMKAQSAPLNKLLRKKQTDEWTRDQYRDMNSLLLDLRSATSDMRLQGAFQKKQMISDNDSIITAKQKGYPSASTYNVNVTSQPVAASPALVKFTTDNTLKDASTEIGQAFSFTIGPDGDPSQTKIDVESTDTINSIITKINAVSSTTGVKANYLADDKSITFTTLTTGSSAAVKIGNMSNPSNKLGISEGDTTTGGTGWQTNAYKAGTDVTPGSVEINGIKYGITSSTFTFDGIEFNIKGTGTTKVNIKQDEDAIYNTIKSYVDKYNDIIAKLNTKISETQYRDYTPLLDDEKSAMTDKQVEQWEEKAKSGLLKQDPMLSGLLSQMRQSLSSQVTGSNVDGDHNTLSEIGITTGSYYENGKLYIDETKLRQAISENGSAVMDLFTKTSTATDSSTKYQESGLAQRLYDQINSTMTKITEKAGSSASLTDNSVLGKDLTQIAKDITNWQARLNDIEDRYWKQFTAMETALSKANSQSSWLTQQLSS